MRLVLTLGATVLVFTEPTTRGEFPWLTGVRALQMGARAGHIDGIGTTETANVEAELDNDGRQAWRLIGQPLRAPAELQNDAGETVFPGTVAAVAIGRTITLTLES